MPHPHRPALRIRTAAVALAVLAHGLVLLPFLLGKPAARRQVAPTLHFVSLWPDLAVSEPEPEPEPATAPPTAPESSPRIAPPLTPPQAITLAPAVAPDPPAGPTEPSPETAARGIDWNAAAAAATERFVAGLDAPTTFSPPPPKLREPCKPRESSFEWSPEEPRAGLLPLPFVRIGERCIVGLGFFGCALGELPPPNDKLFDDIKKGNTSPSSVPDPHHCD